jgi:hypothetical protein
MTAGVTLRTRHFFTELSPFDFGQYVTADSEPGFRDPDAWDGVAPSATIGFLSGKDWSFVAGGTLGISRLARTERQMYFGFTIGVSYAAIGLWD